MHQNHYAMLSFQFLPILCLTRNSQWLLQLYIFSQSLENVSQVYCIMDWTKLWANFLVTTLQCIHADALLLEQDYISNATHHNLCCSSETLSSTVHHSELLTSNLHYLMAHHRLCSCAHSCLSPLPYISPLFHLSSRAVGFFRISPTYTHSNTVLSSSVCLSPPSFLSYRHLHPPLCLSLFPSLSLFSLASSRDFKCIRIRGSLPLSRPSFRLCSS